MVTSSAWKETIGPVSYWRGVSSVRPFIRTSVRPHLYLGNPLINFSIILQEGSLGEYFFFIEAVLDFLLFSFGFSNVNDGSF